MREEKRRYVEMGTGLNLPLPGGGFVAANPSFALTVNGAEAQNTIHKVVLAPDINVEGAVSVTTPDGAVLRSNPIGFGYYDPVDGRQVILGALTNAVGWLVSSNEVIYSNCFHGGIRASMHYRNAKDGFSQNLILHESISPPEAYGLSAKSRLQLFTQFTDDTPVPAQTVRTLSGERGDRTQWNGSNPVVRMAFRCCSADRSCLTPTLALASITHWSFRRIRDLRTPSTRRGCAVRNC